MHLPKDPKLLLLAVDIDGTVAAPNHQLSGIYENFLKSMQRVSAVEVVLNSGKALPYLKREAAKLAGRYVIANNGAVIEEIGGKKKVFGGHRGDIIVLRRQLGLSPAVEGVNHIRIGNREVDVAIEEDKEDIVLTIFTEPQWVKHRWQFTQGTDRQELYTYLVKLIAEHNLQLHVLHPHGDGAIDVVRLYRGNPIDKSTLPKMAKIMWPQVRTLKIAMFGDGSNDVPAMTAPGVIGVTFPEADQKRVIEPVKAHHGIVTRRNAWIRKKDGSFHEGGGVVEGVRILAEWCFFDGDSDLVFGLCDKAMKKIEARE